MAVGTAKAMLQGKEMASGRCWLERLLTVTMTDLKTSKQDRSSARTMTMFDAQIALALFAAFLLGMVAGSGIEIIVRSGRH
jgi:hypothetical protein